MRFWTRFPILVLALLAAVPAGAQFSQYTAPGSLLDRSTSKKDQMKQGVDNARWKLGPFQFSPWLSIRDAAYVTDVLAGVPETVSGGKRKKEPDFTITAGAGLQGLLPLGSKSYFTLDAMPQYVYWQKHNERRRLNGFYGVGLFGFFNRLELEAVARRAEDQTVLTPEFEQRIHSRQDLLDASVDVQVATPFYVFAGASSLKFRTLVKEIEDDPLLPPFQELDREERLLRAGVEYRPGDRLRLAAGVERSEVEFLNPERDRSNSGTAPVVEADYGSERVKLSMSVARRSLEPKDGSDFVAFDGTTGRARASWTPRWRLSYTVYGSRSLDYSLDDDYSHFTADRLGFSIGAKIGRTSSVDLFYETGTHDYERLNLAALPRQEDFTGYGTALHLQIEERVRFHISVQRTRLDSSLPGLDRDLTTVQSSLEISAFGGALTIR